MNNKNKTLIVWFKSWNVYNKINLCTIIIFNIKMLKTTKHSNEYITVPLCKNVLILLKKSEVWCLYVHFIYCGKIKPKEVPVRNDFTSLKKKKNSF